MRLSDIKGERTLDVIAEIIDPIANIASDKEIMPLFKREKVAEGADINAIVANKIKTYIPKLVKAHKRDFIAIFAALDSITPEEYTEKLDLVKLLSDATDLMNDPLFNQLFFSAQSGNSSGSAQETTGGP